MTTKHKKAIEYGKVELSEDEFEPRNVKIRVTTLIDEDVLLALKELARKKGMKYQTLLNGILRTELLSKRQATRPNFDRRVREIVRDELRKRA